MYFLCILLAVDLPASAQENMEPLVIVGKGGYEHQIFNDGRGDLKAQAYGSHLLGNSSHFGGALNWNAAASLDISKQIYGGTSGKGGYEHQIFNDGRGDLKAQAYGSHLLGNSSHFGGALNWNAAASLDISKQIYGGTSYQAAAGGRWPVGKNGDFSLQGTYGKQWGQPKEYGGLANFNYRW